MSNSAFDPTRTSRNSRRVGIGTFAHKNITQIAPRSNCTRFEPKVRIRYVVMLMTDDTGWNDFGAYSGGKSRSRDVAYWPLQSTLVELHHETLDSGSPHGRRSGGVILRVRGRQDCRSGPRRFCRWFRMEAGSGHSAESRLLGTSCRGARDQLSARRSCDAPRSRPCG